MEALPKRRWHLYALSVLPFMAGLAICALLGIKVWQNFVRFDNSLIRVVVPGREVVMLPAPGDYTIFHESKTVMDGVVYSAPEYLISGLSCSMKDNGTGADVALKPSSSNMTYSFGSKEGRAIFEFNAKEGGAFLLNCSFPGEGREGIKTVLAIGRGFGAEIFNTISFIFGIIAIFILSFGISAAAIVYLIVKKPAADVNG